MRTVQSLSTKSYTLSIASIKIGEDSTSAQELLSFSGKKRSLPGLLDTGSPCIMLPNGRGNGAEQGSPYALYQRYPNSKWSKMWITVDGIDKELEIAREDLEVEHQTFLDEAWGTSLRPCVLPVNPAAAPPLDTPIVLGAVFFRAYSVLFDLSHSSASQPPTIGLAKINPAYNIVGISDYSVRVKGGDGSPVQRVFVQVQRRRGVGLCVSHVVGYLQRTCNSIRLRRFRLGRETRSV